MENKYLSQRSWKDVVIRGVINDYNDEFCLKNLNKSDKFLKLCGNYDYMYYVMFKRNNLNEYYSYIRFKLDIMPKFNQLTEWEKSKITMYDPHLQLPHYEIYNYSHRESYSAKAQLINIDEITNVIAKKMNKKYDNIKLINFKKIKYIEKSFFSTHVDNKQTPHTIATVLFIDGCQKFSGGDLILGYKNYNAENVNIQLYVDCWNCIIFNIDVPHCVLPIISGERIVYKATIELYDNINMPINKFIENNYMEKHIINFIMNKQYEKLINKYNIDIIKDFCKNYKKYNEIYEILNDKISTNSYCILTYLCPIICFDDLYKILNIYISSIYETKYDFNMNIIHIITKIWKPISKHIDITYSDNIIIKPYPYVVDINNLIEYTYKIYSVLLSEIEFNLTLKYDDNENSFEEDDLFGDDGY